MGECRHSGNELLFYCPFCNHRKRKLSFNVQKHLWKCWICNERGRSLFSLYWKIGKPEAFKDCQDLSRLREEKQEKFNFSLPDEYVHLFHAPRHIKRYVANRNVSDQQALRRKIGYCPTGRYKNRIILPSFCKNGNANFFTARATYPTQYRYLNPATPPNYKKSIILNELELRWDKPIVIVEGFFDMLRVPNATPIFGSILSDDCSLFQQLVVKQCTVYVCLDPDARKKQLQLIEELNSFGLKVYDVALDHIDLADSDDDAVIQAFKNAQTLNQLDLIKERMKCVS